MRSFLAVLVALFLTFVGTLVTAMTTTGPRLVALGEDYLAPEEASLAVSGGSGGSDFAFLDGYPRTPERSVSHEISPARQGHYRSRGENNGCQDEDGLSHGTPPGCETDQKL
jgi:hypothetical protein